jgi:hypothetical protein
MSCPTGQDVVAVAADDGVRAQAAGQRVIAEVAKQEVIAGCAVERIVAGVAIHDVAEVGANEILDAVVRVALSVVGQAANIDVDGHAESRLGIACGVEAVAAEQLVGTGAAVQPVVSCVAVEDVVAGATVDMVMAVAAEHRVVASATIQTSSLARP